jgi:dolichol-phosphate mannosyltransferase
VLLQAIYGKDHIHILARAGKLGLGSAYTDGLKVVTGTHVILMDADLSHHPKFVPALIAKQQQGNYDVVTGTRYAMGGGVSS